MQPTLRLQFPYKEAKKIRIGQTDFSHRQNNFKIKVFSLNQLREERKMANSKPVNMDETLSQDFTKTGTSETDKWAGEEESETFWKEFGSKQTTTSPSTTPQMQNSPASPDPVPQQPSNNDLLPQPRGTGRSRLSNHLQILTKATEEIVEGLQKIQAVLNLQWMLEDEEDGYQEDEGW